MAHPFATIASNGGTSMKLYGATAGAALGEIVSAVLQNGAGWQWWPGPPTTILAAFALGYFMPDKRPDDDGGEK